MHPFLCHLLENISVCTLCPKSDVKTLRWFCLLFLVACKYRKDLWEEICEAGETTFRQNWKTHLTKRKKNERKEKDMCIFLKYMIC